MIIYISSKPKFILFRIRVPYDGSIVNMGIKNADGSICYIIGMLKSIREQLGKSEGDEVEVTVCER